MRTLLKLSAALFILCLLAFKVSAQNIYTFAGTGVSGYSGDGAAAANAKIYYPMGLAFDAAGNLYISDQQNSRVRKVDPAGIITTFAGNGVSGFSGDGSLATSAKITGASNVAVDAAGNVYIADELNHRIRKVNTSGIISTFAGNGVQGFSGDGGLATSAAFNQPNKVACDAAGNVYITDYVNQRIRRVNTLGVVSTIVGTGVAGYNGDGGPAASAQINYAEEIKVDASGNLYIADVANQRIRMVDGTGNISTIAGTGIAGFSGDGGLAVNAQLYNPTGVEIDAFGIIYITDNWNSRIRIITSSASIITIAGTGVQGYSGDFGPALNAQLNGPRGLAVDQSGNVYIGDYFNSRIRIICTTTCNVPTGVTELNANEKKFIVYPNPNNGSFSLKIENGLENSIFILFNSLGQKVHEQKMLFGENKIIAHQLCEGLYSYVLLKNDQKIFSGKLAVE